MNEDLFKARLRSLADEAVPHRDAVDRLVAKRRTRELRRRVGGGLATVAVVAALSVIGWQLRSGEPAPPLGTSDPTPSSSLAPIQVAATIAYSVDGDVYVLDQDGGTRRITDDGPNVDEDAIVFDALPRLRGEDQLWWIARGPVDGPSILWQMDLSTGDRSALVEIDGWVQAFDAQDDHGRLAFTAVKNSQQRVFVLDLDDPRFAERDDPAARWDLAEERWAFPAYLGRGTTSEDEVSVAWSPDGSTLLVVNTFVDGGRERGDETLLVLDATGKPVVAPIHGTFGRWIVGDEFLYRPMTESDWRILNVATGRERAFAGLPSTAVAPSVSPDRRRIVAQQERPAPALPTLYAVDLASGRALLDATIEGLWPVWLDDGTIVATALEACTDDCVEHWRRLPETFIISLDDGQQSPYGIAGTFDLDIRYALIGESE